MIGLSKTYLYQKTGQHKDELVKIIVQILYLTYQSKFRVGNKFAVSILSDVDEFKVFKDGLALKSVQLNIDDKKVLYL